jgi:hypothetical protein
VDERLVDSVVETVGVDELEIGVVPVEVQYWRTSAYVADELPPCCTNMYDTTV